MEYNYHGIVLRQRKIGETDRLYTLYTLENGKFAIIGKGVRKMMSKNAPHLEDFMLSHVAIVRGRGLGVIKSAVAEYDFPTLHRSVDALQCAYRVRNLFDRLIDEREQDQKIFLLYTTYLRLLDYYALTGGNEETMTLITESFLMKLYHLLGYHFSFGRCTTCKYVFIAMDRILFSAESGGLLCTSCARSVGNAVVLSQNAVKILRLIPQYSLKNLVKIRASHVEIQILRSCNDHIAKWIMR